jgi:hypothetical protein
MTFHVERLVNRTKVNRKIMFEVKWKGVPKTTQEPRTSLIKQIPDLVKEYETNHPQ